MGIFQEVSSEMEQVEFKNAQLNKRKLETRIIETDTQPKSTDTKNPENGIMRTGEGFWVSVVGTTVKINTRLSNGDVYSVTMTKE